MKLFLWFSHLFITIIKSDLCIAKYQAYFNPMATSFPLAPLNEVSRSLKINEDVQTLLQAYWTCDISDTLNLPKERGTSRPYVHPELDAKVISISPQKMSFPSLVLTFAQRHFQITLLIKYEVLLFLMIEYHLYVSHFNETSSQFLFKFEVYIQLAKFWNLLLLVLVNTLCDYYSNWEYKTNYDN